MRLFAETALLPEGWARDVVVEVAGGRIVSVTQGGAGDQRVGCLLPAAVNLHSHAFQRAMAGLTERRGATADSFWTWRDLMYRFLDRLTPEDVEAIAAQVMVEMAEAGYAAVAEFHYLHHGADGAAYADLAEMAGRIVAASSETGLGLTLLPVLYQQGGLDGRALAGGQRRFGNDLERFGRLWQGAKAAMAALPEDAVLGVAPHSLRAVTGAGLEFAATLGGPVHIHVAEQMAEVDEVRAHTDARPVEWLLGNADVDGRWCAIHATQMLPSETEALARSGAVAGLCPITEANLGDGLFPMQAFVREGGRFGVGSDSNVLIDAAEELRLLEYGQRLALRGRNVLAPDATRSSGRFLFEGALQGGAQALGVAAGLQVGASADLLELDPAHPALQARQNDAWLDSWVFAARNGALRSVWRHGRQVVADGRHLQREAITTAFAAALRGVLG